MENNNEYNEIKNQMKDNIIKWYPFEENVKYITLKNFSKENESELINIANNLENGTRILICLENKLGIRNLCRDKNEIKNLYNRKEIEELLNQNDLTYRKFYYPLPDCDFTNVIFTDEHLPNIETITRNIAFYKENEIEKNNENEELIKLLEQDENLFKMLTNSYFIECAKEKFEDNLIEFVSYSNMRKNEYRIITTIKGNKVYKEPATEEAKAHIENIKRNIDILKEVNLNTLDQYDEEKVISRYAKNEKTVEEIIINYIKNGQEEKAQTIIQTLIEELKQKLINVELDNLENCVFDKYEIEYEKEQIKNLTFVKNGFWDMIFSNIFYIGNEYYFYDQEWIEEILPIEFIIYRAFKYNEFLKVYEKENSVYEKFNINKENIELFEQLDMKLQNSTRDSISWKMHTQKLSIKSIEEDCKNKIEQLKIEKEQVLSEARSLLIEKDARIKFLEDNMEATCNMLREKEQSLQTIQNSRMWKILNKIKKLKK